MNTSTIKSKVTKSRGKFMRVNLENSKGSECFMGKIKSIGETFVTFDRFSGKRGEVKAHRNSIKSISVV
jgi:hypothetical protein